MKKLNQAVVALSVALGAAAIARATVVVPISLDDMAAGAHRIFVGQCTSVRSYWEGKKIWTEVHFQVKQRVKGEPASEVSFRQVGGSVTEPVPVEMRVVGAPNFEPGETDLMFLERGPDGSERVMGLFQGRLRLSRDPASGEWRVENGERLGDILARVEARVKTGPKP